MRWRNTRELMLKNSMKPADFARRLDKDPQQVNAFAGPNPNRNIGPRIARQIEQCFQLPRGWLDKDHSTQNEDFSELNGLAESYRQAEEFAEALVKSQQNWLKSRRHAVRKIEDDFSEKLLSRGFNILDLGSEFDFRVTSTTGSLVSINLFIPMPGFSRWLCPGITDEQPDILAIPFLNKSTLEYSIIPKAEYLQWGDKAPFRVEIKTINQTANGRDLIPFLERFDLM